MPKFELPKIDLPSAEQLADCGRNAVYVGVGFVVTVVDRVVGTVKAGVDKVRPAA